MADTVKTSVPHFVGTTDGEKPLQIYLQNPEPGQVSCNLKIEPFDVEIENIRGKEDSVSLDTAGFQYFHAGTKLKSFVNAEEIQKVYYPESIELLKRLTGANRIIIFDHTVRKRRPGDTDDRPGKRQPVPRAHVDQTSAAAIARVHRHLPAEEVPGLLKKRFQIINLWRPIYHPALDCPLTLCDYRSIDPQNDLIPTILRYSDRDGETFNIRHNPNHKWKYLRGQTPEEVVLIKCFDSIQDGSVAVLTPHSSFFDPTTPPDAPPRESIEVRTLVFYD